jgi:hypothetical protein
LNLEGAADIPGALLMLLTFRERALSPDGSVDVHGATAAEAIIIVKEILDETGASPRTSLALS